MMTFQPSHGPDERLGILVMRYLDGRLDRAGTRELNDLLAGDPAARDWFREIAGQAVALGDLGRGKQVAPAGPGPGKGRETGRAMLALAAAMVLLGILAGSFLTHGKVAPVVTVQEVSGAVSWFRTGEPPRGGLKAGDRLPAGSLQTEGDVSSVEVRFLDGSVLRLGGSAEANFGEGKAKSILLKNGVLSAQVVPQPPGRPLRIRTATASLEVVGTSFSVTAEPDSTRLAVEEGAVRMRRLVDGMEVEVKSNQAVAASLDSTEPFQPKGYGEPPLAWRMPLDAPTQGSKGVWNAGTDPVRVAAVPLISGRTPDGEPVVHYGVGFRDRTRDGGAFARITGESRLRFRFRTRRETDDIYLFLTTDRPGGRFGGNFELHLPEDAAVDDGTGWRIVDISFSRFEAVPGLPGRRIDGKDLVYLSVKTFRKSAGLELAELEILPGDGR